MASANVMHAIVGRLFTEMGEFSGFLNRCSVMKDGMPCLQQSISLSQSHNIPYSL